MIYLYSTLLAPLFGLLLLSLCGHLRIAGIINIAVSAASFIASIFLTINFIHQPQLSTAPIILASQFYIDAFNLMSIVLTTFVTTTTAIFSHQYMWHNVKIGRITLHRLRLYHIMYQLFAFMILLTFSSNNIGIIWVAIEGATLATVLLVSLYRTPEAIEAAWKYFILCIVGIALALLGTILVYSSASSLPDTNNSVILWSVLYKNAKLLDAPIIKLAFVFLLVGYGTKIGLVPLHNWLPDTYSESPAPITTLLSGLFLNAALYALIRFKILVDLALNNHMAGNLMMGFGLLSFLVAAILLHRKNNIKRIYGYSSIEHMGLITFAFGLGGQLATFAAIFYMLIHSLIKSAIFITIGNAIQLSGTQSIEKIRGLIKQQPWIGWGLLIATIAICGFPPFGIFTSEVMIIIATIKTIPWLTIFILAGTIIALAGLLKNIQPIVFGNLPIQAHEDNGEQCISLSSRHLSIAMLPAIAHLFIAFIFGVYLPPVLTQLLKQATILIAG